VVIITDSDSESGLQKSRKGDAKEIKKLATAKERVMNSKVPRLENATMNQETSSDVPVTYHTVFSCSGEKPRKRQCEDHDDKMKIKKNVHEQNARPPDDTSDKNTALQNEVCDRISECEEVYELEKDINITSKSEIVSVIAQESKLVGDHLSSGVMNSKSVESVSLPSEVINKTNTSTEPQVSVHSTPASFVTATSIKRRIDSKPVFMKRRFDSDPLSATFTNCKTTTTHSQPTEAESEILNHSRNDSLTMNTTMVSVPCGVTEHTSEEMESAVQDSVKSRFAIEMLNSKPSGNICSPVTKEEVLFVDDDLQRIPAVSTCGFNEKVSKQNLETALHKEQNNRELSINDTKNASRHNKRQSPADNKSLCFVLSEVNTCLGTANTADTFNNFTGDSGNVAAHTSVTSDFRNEGAITSESGTCIAVGDNLMPEVRIEMEKGGVPFPLSRKNQSNNSNSNTGITSNKQFSAAQEYNLGETSAQNKEWDEKRKSNKIQSILPEPCSVELNHIVSKCEQVSKSEQVIFFSNTEVKTESCRHTAFKKESTKYLEKPVKKKLKMTEQNLNRSYKLGSSLVSKKPSMVSAKQSESFVMTRDDNVRAGNKSQLLENAPTLCVITSHDVDDEDAYDNPAHLRLQAVLHDDQNKTKYNISDVKYQDRHPQTIVKTEGSSGSAEQPVDKCEPLPTACLLCDEEQLQAKQKKSKPHRQHILSVSSSSSVEDAELQGNQKKLESAGQTKGTSNSHVHLLKGKRKLLSSSESSSDCDSMLVMERSAESVIEIVSNNSKSDVLTKIGVNSVDECKEKNTAQENKHRVDSSNTVEETTNNKELFASVCKKKAVVELERLDENILKSKGLVSEPENESLNYSLNEDIIVVSDDDHEYFLSSQIFDDEKIPLELLKTECQDTANEDPSFNKDIEDDDVVFVDDDSDLDNDQWFKRLSQQDVEPEPSSELPSQHLQAETKTKDRVSGGESLKDANLPHVFVGEVAIEEELLASDLFKADEEVKLKQKQSVNKCKYNVKALIIDAPPLPPRRAFQRGISAEVATQMYKEQTTSCQKPVKCRSIISDTTCKRTMKSKKKEGHVHLSVSSDINLLTAKQKKQIADKRKEKLKAISEKEKAVAAASKKHSVKVPAEVRIKVTDKNRGAFLTEGAEKTDDVAKVSATAQTSLLSSVIKKSHSDAEKALSLKVPKQDGVRSSILEPKKCELGSSCVPTRNIKDLPRIPRISERSLASKSVNLKLPPGAEVETIVEDMPPLLTSASPSFPIVKTLAPTGITKKKKNVTFKKDSELVEIRIIPVAEDSRLLPVAHKKDAPTPRKICSNQLQQKGPDLEEVLYDILCWNPKWLEVSHKYFSFTGIRMECEYVTLLLL
jgi:hypothetical protein